MFEHPASAHSEKDKAMGGRSGNVEIGTSQSVSNAVLVLVQADASGVEFAVGEVLELPGFAHRYKVAAVAEAYLRKKQPPRDGKVERTVLTVLESLELVCERVAQHALIRHAVATLDAPQAGLRDTRRQDVMRAVRSLVRKGRLRLVDGWVET